MRFVTVLLVGMFGCAVQAQTNVTGDNRLQSSGSVTGAVHSATNQPNLAAERAEAIRSECIKGRRSICGKILKVLPDGLVVDSGYTDLMRPPLNQSWLVPGTATANRTPDLVEGHEPECVAVGLLFITDLPKSRGAKPKLYDYVVVTGYPAGQYTYTSVGDVRRTVRRFTTTLTTAVELNLQSPSK